MLRSNNSQRSVDRSTRGPDESAAGQEMEVNMENGLAGAWSVVDDHPVSLGFQTIVRGDLFCHKKKVSDEFAVGDGYAVYVGNVFFWNDEKVGRCLGIKVLKHDSILILKNDL